MLARIEIERNSAVVPTARETFAVELTPGLPELPFPLLANSLRYLAEAVEAATRETPQVNDRLLFDATGRQWLVLVEPCGNSALATWELQ